MCTGKKKIVWNDIHVPNKNEKRKIRSSSFEPNSYVFFSFQSLRASLQSSRIMTFIAEVKKQLNYPIYIYLIVSLGSNKLTFKGLV